MKAFALLLLTIVNQVDAYASWLQCFIDLDESEVVMNHEIIPAEKALHQATVVVRREGEELFQPTLTYPAGSVTKLQAKLAVPAELQSEDVQYVVETTKGAVFTKPEMCRGQRSHARQAHETVLLEIDGSEPKVELLAGWATGHEAVSLTTKTILVREENEL